MKLPAALEKQAARFDALSLRERALTGAALLAAICMIWTIAVLDPISARRNALLEEQTSLDEQIATSASDAESDPLTRTLAKEKELQGAIAAVNHELASKSAGVIPPERMVQVIQDVLSRQRGLRLVSLQNKAVTSLASTAAIARPSDKDKSAVVAADESTGANDTAVPRDMSGPFVHPVEIVVEGSYLDVLAYLQALESLDWRFYWKLLELETQRYPINRVRIELTTLSMDQDWIGV